MAVNWGEIFSSAIKVGSDAYSQRQNRKVELRRLELENQRAQLDSMYAPTFQNSLPRVQNTDTSNVAKMYGAIATTGSASSCAATGDNIELFIITSVILFIVGLKWVFSKN